MLKKFFLNVLSSFVGAWVALVIFGVAATIVIVGVVARMSDSETPSGVKKHSVLSLDLKGTIVESETPNSPDYIALIQGEGLEKPQTLNVIVESIRDAADNKQVEAIYLKCGALSASPATVNAIRNELVAFKKKGKKIYSYGDLYTLGTYYIASVADKIWLNPYGEIAVKGIGGSTMYFKGLLDKVGVEFQVVKVGTFKSAVEPYINSEMSEPARAQLDTLYSTMWDFMKSGICKNRKKLTPVRIDNLVNSGLMFSSAEDAVKNGLVDAIVYERKVDEMIAKIIGVDKEDLNYVNPQTLVGQIPWTDAYASKNCIAVLYATGEIVDGSSSGINYQTLVPIITELAEDDNIKGLVLRVNSPGGSAFGSDQIGEALDYFQSKKKPLAVSMGDYAASGGYWISCGANRIFADPLTITGSIGIFGLIPNAKGLMEKIGVTPQLVSTNPEAVFPDFTAPMTENQLAIMQRYVERGYDRFVARVAKGRKMSESKVRKIAEGRVWNAMKAKEIGLVDSIGSLSDAIEWTARKAEIFDNYDIAAYPVYKPSFWDMIPTAELEATKLVKSNPTLDVQTVGLMVARKLMARNRVLALMPEFDFTIR